MNATDVKACVARQLYRLEGLPKPQKRAELAELRRGVGRKPGDVPALWGKYLGAVRETSWNSSEPSYAEWAVYVTLTLYAMHQQGIERPMNQHGSTLGKAVHRLAESTASPGQYWDESSIMRRFNALATATSMPEVSHYLRGIIQLLRRQEIPLDYPKLAEDLYWFQFTDCTSNIRLRWGRDLFFEPAETNDNEK